MRSAFFFVILSTNLFSHQVQQDWASNIDCNYAILKSVCRGKFSALEIGCKEGCYLRKKFSFLNRFIIVDENQHLLQKLIKPYETMKTLNPLNCQSLGQS